MVFYNNLHDIFHLNSFIKRKINLSIKALIFLFPITLFFYLFSSDFGKFGNLIFLTKKLYAEICFGLFLISIGYVLRYYRWRLIINSFGFYPLVKTDSKLWFASYAFTATPGKLGELIRCFFLKKIFDIPLKYSFFSITIERLFDFIAVLIYLICFIWNYERDVIMPLGKYLTLGIVFFVILIVAIKFKLNDFRQIIVYLCDTKLKFLAKRFKINDYSKFKNLNNIFNINILFKITFLSIISWGLEGIAFLLLLKKLNFDISFLTATFIHTSAGLVGALTMLPGGLGSTEVITVFILKLQTIPIDYGIPVTSIIRLMTLWYITSLGIIFLFIIRKEIFKNV